MSALAGLKVVDMATVIAGPGCARHLADFGADVIKVERPGGDTVRNLGWKDEGGTSLWWRMISRNKRSVVLDLRDGDDLEVMKALLAEADVLVENLRPGKLEALGLGPELLWESNPRLVITRVTGFGQDGPYASKAGFATLAEAMSGFASINGEADGGPLLPPIALTDEATALAAAFATMVALHSGVGQVVDVSLLESMSQLMGPLAAAYAAHGFEQQRMGSNLPYSVPRGTYRTSDDRWIAVSASADSVAVRVMEMIGLGDDPQVASFDARVDHRDVIESRMTEFVATRTADEVLEAFDDANAAAAPVMSVAELLDDPHALDRGLHVELDGTTMQGPVAKLSRTPAELRTAGPDLPDHGDSIDWLR